jgi:hypothetical protein
MCGKPLAAPPAPATATPTSAAPPPTAGEAAPGPAAVGAPGAQKGSPILKIIVAVLAFFFLLTVAGMATCVYVGYKAKQRVSQLAQAARSASITVGTPETRLEKGGGAAGAATAVTEEVPPYPGATVAPGGGSMTFGGAGGISTQLYVTDDTVDKVLAFYKEKLGSGAQIHESNGKAIIQVAAKNGLTTVTISRDEKAGKTRITIGRIGK